MEDCRGLAHHINVRECRTRNAAVVLMLIYIILECTGKYQLTKCKIGDIETCTTCPQLWLPHLLFLFVLRALQISVQKVGYEYYIDINIRLLIVYYFSQYSTLFEEERCARKCSIQWSRKQLFGFC